MNQEIKQKWVAALKSDKYKQCGGALKRTDDFGEQRYCCLGVLTDLYLAEKGEQWTSSEANRGFLPSSVKLWADLDSSAPRVERGDLIKVDYADDEGGDFVRLTYLNDSLKLSFPQIAEMIDRSL